MSTRGSGRRPCRRPLELGVESSKTWIAGRRTPCCVMRATPAPAPPCSYGQPSGLTIEATSTAARRGAPSGCASCGASGSPAATGPRRRRLAPSSPPSRSGMPPGWSRRLGRRLRVAPPEPPTEALVERLAAAASRVMVPDDARGLGPGLARMRRAPTEPLGAGRRSPDATVVFVPGARPWTAAGTRLGQGKGCYDRALARRDPDALVVVAAPPGSCSPPTTLPGRSRTTRPVRRGHAAGRGGRGWRQP